MWRRKKETMIEKKLSTHELYKAHLTIAMALGSHRLTPRVVDFLAGVMVFSPITSENKEEFRKLVRVSPTNYCNYVKKLGKLGLVSEGEGGLEASMSLYPPRSPMIYHIKLVDAG